MWQSQDTGSGDSKTPSPKSLDKQVLAVLRIKGRMSANDMARALALPYLPIRSALHRLHTGGATRLVDVAPIHRDRGIAAAVPIWEAIEPN